MKTAMKLAAVARALAALGATAMTSTASATIISAPSGSNASFVTTDRSLWTFGTGGSAIVIACQSWVMTGTISGSSISVASSGTSWSGCSINVGGIPYTATLTDSSAWTFTITAALGGGSFSVSMTTGTLVWAMGPCTVNFPSQTLSGLIWTNATHSLAFNVSNVSYTVSGFLCFLPPGTTGSWAGSWSEPTLTVS